MPGIFNPATIDWDGEQVMALNEAVFEATFENPALNVFHNLQSGIKAKKQIVILQRLGLIGKEITGESCEPEESDERAGASQKLWDPKVVGFRYGECWTNTKETFFIWATKNGLNKNDLTGTEYARYIMEQIDPALAEAILRWIWFNDTDHDNVDASPAGLLTSGVDAAYFNVIDGFWKQIFDICATTPARRYTITENAGVSYTAQDALAADAAKKVFRALINNADPRLRAKKNKVIVCTNSLWQNWIDYKEDQAMDMSFVRQDKWFSTDVYKGVTLISFEFWDRYIRAYFDNGTTWHRPHRAILFDPENFQPGTEEAGNLSEVDVWYDKKTKKTFFDAQLNIDAKIVLDYEVQAAY